MSQLISYRWWVIPSLPQASIRDWRAAWVAWEVNKPNKERWRGSESAESCRVVCESHTHVCVRVNLAVRVVVRMGDQRVGR